MLKHAGMLCAGAAPTPTLSSAPTASTRPSSTTRLWAPSVSHPTPSKPVRFPLSHACRVILAACLFLLDEHLSHPGEAHFVGQDLTQCIAIALSISENHLGLIGFLAFLHDHRFAYERRTEVMEYVAEQNSVM